MGRGRRREHPNQHFVLLLLEKNQEIKYGKITGEKSTKKKYGNKKSKAKKYGEKSTGKYGGKSKGKSHVTSGDVTSGQACAMVRSSGSSTWILHKC